LIISHIRTNNNFLNSYLNLLSEENSLQVMNKNLQVSSIVMELGEKNLLAYYADIIKNGPNNVELLTSFLISSAESLDQFHKRIF